MGVLLYMIPLTLLLGGVAILAFLWSIKSGQFDDLEGASMRILIDDDIQPNP